MVKTTFPQVLRESVNLPLRPKGWMKAMAWAKSQWKLMRVGRLLLTTYEPLEVVPLELAESFAVGIECRQSVFSSIEDEGWTELKMRDRLVCLQKPSFALCEMMLQTRAWTLKRQTRAWRKRSGDQGTRFLESRGCHHEARG